MQIVELFNHCSLNLTTPGTAMLQHYTVHMFQLPTCLLTLTSAPRVMRYFNRWRWPFCAVMNRGVAPSIICAWRSAPRLSNSSTTSKWLHWQATNRGVPPSCQKNNVNQTNVKAYTIIPPYDYTFKDIKFINRIISSLISLV